MLDDKPLQNKIAEKLLYTLYDDNEDDHIRALAYGSILEGVDVPITKLPDSDLIVGKDYPIDEEKIDEFKKL